MIKITTNIASQHADQEQISADHAYTPLASQQTTITRQAKS